MSTSTAEARRHWDAGRGIMAFFKDPVSGKKMPIMSALKNSRDEVFKQSVIKLHEDPSKYLLAIICGEESNLTMVDIDCKNGKNGMVLWEQMAAANNYEGLATAVWSITPSGGRHYYFLYTPELAHGQEKCFKVGETWADIDIRNKNTCGFGICAPSPGYQWIRSIHDFPVTKCPQWIIDWHKASVLKPVKQAKASPNAKAPGAARGRKAAAIKLPALQSLVSELPEEAYECYDTWLSVLMAIHKISHENGYPEDGLALAHDFSAKSAKYQEAEVNSKWDTFDPELAPGIATILNVAGKGYAAVKARFELTNFKIEHPLQYCLHREGKEIWNYGAAEFKSLYSNLYYYTSEGKRQQFIFEWLGDPECRTYEEIIFNPPPLKPIEDSYNLFNGLAAEKLPPNVHSSPSIKPIKDHIGVLVNGDAASRNYVIKWFAQRVQFPGERPKVALCFKSNQGSGKGIILEWIGAKILGDEYFFGTAGMRDLTGHFNEGLMNKLFIFLDESKTKDSFATADELKRLIDAPTVKINKKYCPVLNLRNCAGWVFASNNSLPVKVEQGDRRYALFQCSDEKKGNAEYFRTLGNYLEREDVTRAFYDYLMSIDLSDFHPERDRLVTSFYQDVQAATIPVEISFIQWLIEEDILKRGGEMTKYKSGEMRDLWNTYKRNAGLPSDLLSHNKLTGAIEKFFRRTPLHGYSVFVMDFDHTIEKLVEAGFKQFAPPPPFNS